VSRFLRELVGAPFLGREEFMKTIYAMFLILLLLGVMGCSVPIAKVQKPLCSFVKEVKTTKGGLMGKKKIVTLKDFRGNEAYEEDMENFQKAAEEYVAQHPSLSETAKNNLKSMQVTDGSTKDEVTLLLGKPDKVISPASKNPYGADEIWVYSLRKMQAYTVFIMPVFLAHESYCLYFKNGVLLEIERHYLRQVVGQAPGPGLNNKSKK
jgi:outer membrane protein assembly factor BamE (lipoprotein component of BamABCDE complex)